MSSINTGAINVNYPVAGVNNNSQGFRDNFNAIKSNLDTASAEITDLQNKAVVKSALNDTTINNDMNNTLISNALIQGFRHTSFNLGNNLTGTVNIDVTRGDVQYGTITGSVSLTFSRWAPTGTRASVELVLNIGTAASTITFPSSVDATKTTLENYMSTSPTFNVVAPAGVSQLAFLVSTVDCGTTLSVTPVNRPMRSTQIQTGAPITSIGSQGDRAGAVYTDGTYLYVCSANYDGTTAIWKRIALSSY